MYCVCVCMFIINQNVHMNWIMNKRLEHHLKEKYYYKEHARMHSKDMIPINIKFTPISWKLGKRKDYRNVRRSVLEKWRTVDTLTVRNIGINIQTNGQIWTGAELFVCDRATEYLRMKKEENLKWNYIHYSEWISCVIVT